MAKAKNKALVVVDVQNCFVKSSSRLVVPRIVQFVQKHRRQYALIIFTRFTNSPISSPCRFLGWKKCRTAPESSFVAELDAALPFGVEQRRSTYSAFTQPSFRRQLKKKRIGEIHLCGLDTDCCVLATAFEGFDRGYRVKVLRNLVASSGGNKYHKTALLILKRNIDKGI